MSILHLYISILNYLTFNTKNCVSVNGEAECIIAN